MDEANKFLDNLSNYGAATVVDLAAEYQGNIVEAVRRTGKSGSLTIKLTYKRNGEHEVVVESSVVPKIPEPALAPVAMYPDENNQLNDENPNQIKITDKVVAMDGAKQVNR